MWLTDGHMGLMWIWWLFGLALLFLVVWAFARGVGAPVPRGGDDSPEAILRRRYARGEIDDQEYERRMSNLRK